MNSESCSRWASTLAKLGSLVPGGGIWMNTQRPEWNDANNALVGYGVSMVTACYLERYLAFLPGLLAPGGHALLCLNAPELSMAWLQDQAREHAPELAFVEHMANPAVFADVGEGRGLKVGAYQLSRQKNQNP